MRILVLDDDYPSPENLYADVFAHVRVKSYKSRFHDIQVVSSFSKAGPAYEYEGISVTRAGSHKRLLEITKDFAPDVVIVHFATFAVIDEVIEKLNIPYVIWVHGFEVTGWYRRLYDFRSAIHFLRYIKGNIIQRRAFRRLIRLSDKRKNIRFVFVSEWIRHVAEVDCGAPPLFSSVIPNPIDDRLFSYKRKDDGDRFKVLVLRPFGGKKHATDLMTEAMVELDRRGSLSRFQFEVRGEGSTSSKMFSLFGQRPNFQFDEAFVRHDALKELHDRNGIIFVVSRQDTHGVSACEGMCSGLVPVSSFNSAIPEYITHGMSGLLTNNRREEIADALVALGDDADLFQRLSVTAAAEARRTSALGTVIARELEVIIAVAADSSRLSK